MSGSFSAAMNTVGATPAASVIRSWTEAHPSKREMSPYLCSGCMGVSLSGGSPWWYCCSSLLVGAVVLSVPALLSSL